MSVEEAEVCLPVLVGKQYSCTHFHSNIHVHMCTVVYIHSPHVQTDVTSGRNTLGDSSAGADTHLGEEEPYQNSMTTAPAPSSSPRVGCIRNC